MHDLLYAGLKRNPTPVPVNLALDGSWKHHMAIVRDVKYTAPPTKGAVSSAEEANADLRRRLDEGMTLVASYWSTSEKRGMAWLDAPCDAVSEIEAWGCTDAWVEHKDEWDWICDGEDTSAPTCADAFIMRNFQLHSPPPPRAPPPPPPPPSPLTFEEGVAVGFGGALVLIATAAAAFALVYVLRERRRRHGGSAVEQSPGAGSPLVRVRGFSAEREGGDRGDGDDDDDDDFDSDYLRPAHRHAAAKTAAMRSSSMAAAGAGGAAPTGVGGSPPGLCGGSCTSASWEKGRAPGAARGTAARTNSDTDAVRRSESPIEFEYL